MPVPHPGSAEMTADGNAPTVTVPSDRCASVCTHPSPVVEAHAVPNGDVRRLVKTLLAAGADATVARDADPSDTPANPIVSPADCVAPVS